MERKCTYAKSLSVTRDGTLSNIEGLERVSLDPRCTNHLGSGLTLEAEVRRRSIVSNDFCYFPGECTLCPLPDHCIHWRPELPNDWRGTA